MSSRRKFQELTIRDNFMFAAVMMRDDNCKKFLEMLLGIKIQKLEVSYEKSIIFNPECKGVRLDIFADDENNTRYDIEMQVAEQDLGKRVRYYHSQMDMELLESGHEYRELPKTYVIFICNFDPFEKGRYCYTFENRCIEEFSISMGDESRSIFLSTEGRDVENISKELKAFMEFVKMDNPENNTEIENKYVKELQQSIRKVKEDRNLESGFMTWEDVKNEARREGRLEGKREIIFKFLEELGVIPERVKERIMSEEKSAVLDAMSKAAAMATSFSDFEEKILNIE